MLTSHEMSVKSPNAVQCMLYATSKDIAAVLFFLMHIDDFVNCRRLIILRDITLA